MPVIGERGFSIGPNRVFWLEYPVFADSCGDGNRSTMSSSNRNNAILLENGVRGWIFQGDRVVGGLDLPPDTARFIERFNREYAAICMWVRPCGAETPRASGQENGWGRAK